ncbi:MAG TPA: NAD(P)-dependent oxidoreductase, partial [Nitrospiraceae bacterium]|nr:NAD(P)-dependent oxidoreductase [Nitrospiraceae bacterium]
VEERFRSQRSGTVLVTGGRGFLGQSVIKKLEEMEVTVSAPPKRDLDLLTGRAQLDMVVRAQGVARVIHLANPRVYTSNLALGETIAMLRNVLEVCALNRLPLVYISSWEVYSGYRTIGLLADEALPLFPSGPYGETKFLAETLINHFRARGELNCAIMRLSPVYGEGGERPKFIHTFIEKARHRKAIATHRYANGSPALDLLHIDDAAAAICNVAMRDYSGDLNIGTGQLTTTRQIAEWIVAWTKSDSVLETVLLDTDTACIAMRSDRARSEIGWEPLIPVVDGLRRLVEAQH